MPHNLLSEALLNSDISLAQRIKGAVRQVEKRRKKVAPADVMNKLIYDAFVVFATKSKRRNSLKFLYDVTRFKYLCGQTERDNSVVNGRSKFVNLDRRFQMLFSITADYIMPHGIREIHIPTETRKEIISIVCEHLDMGTVSHLVGIPSLARFFELRYQQLQNRTPISKMKKIPRNLFERLDYDSHLSPMKQLVDKNIFNKVFDYVILDVSKVYEEFAKEIMDLKQVTE